MASGFLSPAEGQAGQQPQATGATVNGPKPTSGFLPPAAEAPPTRTLALGEDVKHAVEYAGNWADMAWNFTGAMVGGALVSIGARAAANYSSGDSLETKVVTGPDGKPQSVPKDPKAFEQQRRVADEASQLAQEDAAPHLQSPFTGPGHLFELLGWDKSNAKSSREFENEALPSFVDNVMSLVQEGQDKAADSSGGRISRQELGDVMNIVMSAGVVHGAFKGAKPADGQTQAKIAADAAEDAQFYADKVKYKAAHGAAEPAREAAKEMQWSNVDPEHQAAMEKEIQEHFDKVASGDAPPSEPKPKVGQGLAALAEAWNKEPEVRSPEEHAALKKYFKDPESVSTEAYEAIKATMKPLEELTAKDKSLLKKYGPIALASAVGLAAWNQADASDGATDSGALSAIIALGIPLGLKLGKTLGQVREGMSGPSLKFIETLPEDTKVISKQQLKEHLNKPGIAGPEKALLGAIADALPEKGKITPEGLLESLGPTLAKWELDAEVTQKYAGHGLPAIDRFNPKGAETVLYKMKGAESFEIPKHIEGQRATDHFPESPGVFGHIRRFVENGVKHVVELQSDAFQQLSRSAKTPEDLAAWKGNLDIMRSELKRLGNSAGAKLAEERTYIHQGIGTNLFRAKGLVNQLLMDLAESMKDYAPEESKWASGWAERARSDLTLDELDKTIKMAQSGLKETVAKAEKKLEGHDPSKEWGAVSERLKPMAKFYSRRLVREELSESFRQREALKEAQKKLNPDDRPDMKLQDMEHAQAAYDKQIAGASKVRFASADTVAKVEGWPQYPLKEMKQELKESQALYTEWENGDATEEDLERFDHTPETLKQRIQELEKGTSAAEKKLAADPTSTIYAPEHQGIYDRYKKETEQFLRSIGGTVVRDKDGHEWFEVPVENKGLGLGPRAHMAGSVDPKMVAMLAGATIGAVMGYKLSQTAGNGILGAVLGAGGVALLGSGHARMFGKSLAGTDIVKAAVRELSDMLYTTVQGSKADGLDLLNYVKRNLPKSYATHAEAIANHLDNPRKFPLNGEAKRLLDDIILPIQRANAAMVRALKHLGIDTEDLVPGRGARRYFQGTSKGLSALGQELEKGGRVGGSRTLSTRVAGSTDQAFHSYKTMSGQEFIGKLGKDGVVDIYNNGQVVGKGKWDARKQEMSYIGQTFKAARPKMEQVELHTGLKYEREPLLAEMDANLRLKSALANAYFLDNFKKMPGFSNLGFKPEPHDVVPEGWRSVPQLPGLRGYKFEPRIAEALEDFAADQSKGFWHYASKVNRMFVGSMFWTPFLHIGNVAVHALQEKGVVGLMKNLPINLKTSWEAYKEVSQMGPKYRAYLRDGGSFMYPDRLLGEFNGNLLKALGKDPQAGGAVAKAFGYANPLEMVRRLYKLSGDSLWKWNDIFMMQGYLEKEARGLQRDDAMRKTEAHVPNYRIPSRVLDSRALSSILSENGPLSFARYDYGRLKSYGETIKDLVGKDKSMGDRAHALDQLAMLGLIMVAYDQLGDRVAKWVTGNEGASAMRLGSATIPQMIHDAWTGEADKRAPVVNLYHLSPVFELLPQVVANKDLYTGQDWAKTPGDAAMKTAEQLSPVKLASDTMRERNPTSPASVFWSQLGIKDPSQDQLDRREKRKSKRLAEREAQ